VLSAIDVAFLLKIIDGTFGMIDGVFCCDIEGAFC
jgi:hypothetical protein